MYPNPQDVLPLPPRPHLEQYKKRAKDLVKACNSGDENAIRAWAADWIRALVAHAGPESKHTEASIQRQADQIAMFAKEQFARGERAQRHCALADAQFVIARASGFASWPRFAHHLEALAQDASGISLFEQAADAIVSGDASHLARLIRRDPGLVRARSTREHGATLLHYVSANGVENYRQKTPKNAPAIAAMLLEAGADVDAEADVYGGGATTLGLTATSIHPEEAGVQIPLIDVLLEHRARLDDPRGAGNEHNLVKGCLANGQPEAAKYLVERGATLDLAGAAGIGRADVVATFFNDDNTLRHADDTELTLAFGWACGYGRAEVVELLLHKGVDVDRKLTIHGNGHTGLHIAAVHAHVDVMRVLLRHGASVDVIDDTWRTPPIVWALHGWSEEPTAPAERYYEAVTMLVRAGAQVKAEWLEWEKVKAEPEMRAALAAAR